MMLGKRSRAPVMKRTTSMTGITSTEGPRSLDPDQNLNVVVVVPELDHNHDHGRYSSSAFLSPKHYNNNNRNSPALPNFMRTCGLCNRRLSPGRDIYMYRGDTAFCSQECREQQIKVDERKEKPAAAINAAASKNVDSHRNHSEASSGKGETIAAA